MSKILNYSFKCICTVRVSIFWTFPDVFFSFPRDGCRSVRPHFLNLQRFSSLHCTHCSSTICIRCVIKHSILMKQYKSKVINPDYRVFPWRLFKCQSNLIWSHWTTTLCWWAEAAQMSHFHITRSTTPNSAPPTHNCSCSSPPRYLAKSRQSKQSVEGKEIVFQLYLRKLSWGRWWWWGCAALSWSACLMTNQGPLGNFQNY